MSNDNLYGDCVLVRVMYVFGCVYVRVVGCVCFRLPMLICCAEFSNFQHFSVSLK